MKKLFPAVVALGLLASGAAFAQTAPAAGTAASGGSSTNPVSATTPDSNRAGNTNDANNGTTAAPGGGLTHNNDPAMATMSDTGTMVYTESDARGRFNSDGYTSVTGLSRDDGSMWHAKAIKDGKWVQVTLDTHGNIMSQ